MIEFIAHLSALLLASLTFHRLGRRDGYRRGVNDLRDHLLAHLAPDQSRESLDIRLLAIQVRANQLGVDKSGRVS